LPTNDRPPLLHGPGRAVVTEIEENGFGGFQGILGRFESFIDFGQLVEVVNACARLGCDFRADTLNKVVAAIAEIEMDTSHLLPVKLFNRAQALSAAS